MKRKELLEKYDGLIKGYYDLLGEINLQKKELDSIFTENPDDSAKKELVSYFVSDNCKLHLETLLDILEKGYITLKKPITGWLEVYFFGVPTFVVDCYEEHLKIQQDKIKQVEDFIKEQKVTGRIKK